MGHKNQPLLPDTAPWGRVVGHLAEGDSVAVVAAATTEAAAAGLEQARGDAGYIHTVYLLAKVALAAREDDFAAALRRAAVGVAAPPGVFELTAAVSDAIEAHAQAAHRASDIGDMARLAAVESLTALLTNETPNLFDVAPAEVQAAARGFSTPAGFSTLFHDFYARFAHRFLGYHLGRELSFHVGGNGRFPNPDAHSAFVRELDHHCRQAAMIVQEYAGDWYSKHNFLGGITPAKAKRFANHCLDKLRDELLVRGAA